jgi:hypothetical protein
VSRRLTPDQREQRVAEKAARKAAREQKRLDREAEREARLAARKAAILCAEKDDGSPCGGLLVIVGWACTVCERCNRRRSISRGQAVNLRRRFPRRIQECEADRSIVSMTKPKRLPTCKEMSRRLFSVSRQK